MDWIASMYGPHFLLFYGAVIALTLGASWWLLRRLDPTASLRPPSPSEPDPYEVAYLRGGENEVIRVAIVSLTQRGYLRVSEETRWFTSVIEHAPEHPDTRHLSPLELELFGMFSTPLTAELVFRSKTSSSQAKELCAAVEQQLQTEQLLNPPALQSLAWKIGLTGAAVIIGLGGYKLLAALERGRYNVGFLIFMGIFSLGILYVICRRQRLSSRGRLYLKLLQSRFETLKAHPNDINPAVADTTLPLLVGLFGVGVLAGTSLDYYQGMFGRASSSWGGGGAGFGGGCGAGGCGGGGCGGGGCGGGGCGGCGGG